MVEIDIFTRPDEVTLRMPREEGSLPIPRQAVRSLGEALDADAGALAQAEQAVTRACTAALGEPPTAVTRSPRTLDLRLRADGRRLLAQVGDGSGRPATMLLRLSSVDRDDRPPIACAIERVVRRVTAIFAAETNLPADRLVESLLIGELLARHGPRWEVGGRLRLGLEHRASGLRLRVGPLVAGGGDALLREAGLPVAGSVIERLADEVTIEVPGTGPACGGEYLITAVAPRAA
jgi:hypothetical protein